MVAKLFFQALIKYVFGVVIVGALIFLPAGTFSFFNGWLFMAILFLPILIAGVVMFFKNPELLKKRLDSKEKQKDQNIVVKLSGLMFLVGFILCGLGFRFGWYTLPKTVSIIAAAVFLFSYVLYAQVMRENAYLSRTVKVEENQKVVDTGLYAVVRHPMYSATVLMFLAMPLVLGSPISFIIMLGYIPVIAKRIRNEEEVLTNGLDGYKEYKTRVKHKVLPFIW